MNAQITGAVLPAGRYYVGDPCYSIPDELWMEWLEAANYLDNPRVLVAEVGGHTALGVGTAYGDGEYHGSDGNSYGVDAGLIGVVPEELGKNGSTLYATQLVEFDTDFECRYEDGVIVLGHIRIDTDPDEGEGCWTCNGSGEVECTECGSVGEVEDEDGEFVDCDECNGHGATWCNDC